MMLFRSFLRFTVKINFPVFDVLSETHSNIGEKVLRGIDTHGIINK